MRHRTLHHEPHPCQPAAASPLALRGRPHAIRVVLTAGHYRSSHLSIKEDDFGDQPINTRLVYLGHDSLPKQALEMNQICTVLLAVTLLLAGVRSQRSEVLEQDQNIEPDGTYFYRYKLSDGTEAQEQGQGGRAATGGYKYTSPEGEVVQITYTADENGYNPVGDVIPQPPPIPDAILRALEYIRTHAKPSRK